MGIIPRGTKILHLRPDGHAARCFCGGFDPSDGTYSIYGGFDVSHVPEGEILPFDWDEPNPRGTAASMVATSVTAYYGDGYAKTAEFRCLTVEGAMACARNLIRKDEPGTENELKAISIDQMEYYPLDPMNPEGEQGIRMIQIRYVEKKGFQTFLKETEKETKKIYVMSKTVDGNIQKPKISKDAKTLHEEMVAEHAEILKTAGHLGRDLGMAENGNLVAYYGTCRHVWRIDEFAD